MPTLRIVSVNDVYSLENLPRLRSLVKHHRTNAPADVVLVTLAGDFLAPSLLSSIDAGRGMVECLNAVGVTHVILGNHEDDLPPEELRDRLKELDAVCLGTNVNDRRSGAERLDLPRNAIIDVARGLRVGLVGVVMADASLYRGKPFGGADLAPANDAALEETTALLRAGCAAVVPLTHQSAADDRALAIAQASSSQGPFPIILGGHEHTPMLLHVDGTWIVKAGAEAVHAVITELVWSSVDARPTVTTRLEAVSQYPEDVALRALVDLHMKRVYELSTATLLHVAPGEPLSSIGTRSRQTSIGTLICSRLRDALGAEVCVFNGGGIRASREYPHHFTYGDVEAEVPFDNAVVVVSLPGRVLREAVVVSRSMAPADSGGFLQVDDGVVVDASNVIVSIAGEPLDPDREYSVALVRELLLGLDKVEPLVRWATENPARVPPADTGREPKMVLVQSFAVAIWDELGGFDALDTNGDGRVTPSEVSAAVTRKHPSHPPSPVLADLVIRAVDGDADHVISREDAAAELRQRRTSKAEP